MELININNLKFKLQNVPLFQYLCEISYFLHIYKTHTHYDWGFLEINWLKNWFPTYGLPDCILWPVLTFESYEYTIKITQ